MVVFGGGGHRKREKQTWSGMDQGMVMRVTAIIISS